MSLGFCSVPILHSSMSDLNDSIFGFLATSFEQKRYSNGANPLGKNLFLRFKMSESSSANSSISTFSKLSIST